MSDLLKTVADCEISKCSTCSAIRSILRPKVKDLGGFSVRRLMPSDQLKAIGPFIFFDHFGPARFQPGDGIDVRPHPHIGLATITYLFEGEILHRDNLGNVQPISPGAINLMTAGRGIVHSERTPPEARKKAHTTHGLQLWIALPKEQEETDPGFFHYEASRFSTVQVDEATIRVLIGEAYGVRSPVKTFSPTVYVEVQLKRGSTLRLADGIEERAVYVVSGALRARGTSMGEHSLAIFDQTPDIEITALEDTRMVLLGGSPLGARILWWNLVSTRPELIEKAKNAWREDRYPKIPGETEFIPLPD